MKFKKHFMTIVTVLLCGITTVGAQWTSVGDKIKKQEAEEINPENVLPECPRPIMERA